MTTNEVAQYHMLRVRSHFDAAHQLSGYDGPCANLHGHRWEVLCSFSVRGNDDVGIAVDFKMLKKMLAEVLPDHMLLNSWLNENHCSLNPTAEVLVRVIALKIKERLSNDFHDGSVNLARVELWESPDCSVVYHIPRF